MPDADGAGDDRGREDEADDGAADGAPQEAVAGLVVGHLLDVDLALVVGVGDQDAVDVDGPLDLGVDQRVVGRLGAVHVGELGHDERLVALDGDPGHGLDAEVVAGHGHGRVDRLIRRCRRVLRLVTSSE